MNILLNKLNEIFKIALNRANYFCEKTDFIQECLIPSMGNFQCNISLTLAKEYKTSPLQIANEIINCIPQNDIIENCTVAGAGFINFFINKNYLNNCIKLSYDNFSKKLYFSNLKTIVDYGGANVAKPLHVGHLRSATIGESIKRICKYVGNNTLGDVHLGDWGLQMGMIISELKRKHPEWIYFDKNYNLNYPTESPISIKDLETLYPEANTKAKASENFMLDARNATYELQNGRKGYVALWKHIVEVSKKDLRKNYKSLNANFDLWLGESDTQECYEFVIDYIEKKGLAKQSQGALVVDVSSPSDINEIPPFILKKSDGSVLYSTTDLATIVQRDKDYNVDRIIYVVDNRQQMHFTQLFRCVEKTEITSKKLQLDFVGFGTMNGKDGKPYKTRDGGVMQLNKLIYEVKEKAKEKLIESNKQYDSLTEKQKNNIINKVAISALKFADLSIYRSKDYIFDIDKFCSFEGKTGPYLLYTITRAKSILNKAKYSKKSAYFNSNYYDDSLSLLLLSFKQQVLHSYKELAPNYICDYAYKLANKFNSFYNSCNIINEKNEEKKLALLSLTDFVATILSKAMNLLGIKILNRM